MSVLLLTFACAAAPPAGQIVRIADEQAVIVWSAASKTEHFIRRASFTTDANDFGFLVPTPSRPTLAEADQSIFDKLAEATKPEVKSETGFRFEPTFACLATRHASVASAPPEQVAVKVLEVTRVAGYDAAVLAADDASALSKWLEDHGYPASEPLKKWLGPYVEKKWIVTAFKVARREPGAVGTSAVRLTFASERPFYPYREPDDQASGGARSLGVYLVSDTRMLGTVGGNRWIGLPVYARKDIELASLLPGVPDLPARAWVQSFLDLSSPRVGTEDLFFDRAAEAELIPPPVFVDRRVHVPIPIDLVVLSGIAIAFTARMLRRRPA